MNVISQWMTNFSISKLPCSQVILLFSLIILSSCNPTEITSSGQRTAGTVASADLYHKAYIYPDGPAIVEGLSYGPAVNMKSSTDFGNPKEITRKSQLKGDCKIDFVQSGPIPVSVIIPDCIRSYGARTAEQTLLGVNTDGSWIYPVNSPEYYQVNNLYHVQLGVDTFFDKLEFAYSNFYGPFAQGKIKHLPKYLNNSKMFWFQAITPANDNSFRNSFLDSYALCKLELNAKFSPAGPDLCFGNWEKHPSFLFIQDPSVIYHELGHALVAVMMNFRNGIDGTSINNHPFRSNLGGNGYDEAGSLGEGFADYYSFVMTERTHFGEWALGKALNASRPMVESDPLHISGLDELPEGRLSYPQYLLYDPNQPNIPFEGVHYAGQIASHYLVALTKEFQNKCSIPEADKHKVSTSYVMMLLAESFSELGDLRAQGIDQPNGTVRAPSLTYFTNLDPESSYMWSQVVNPVTYRRFFQVLAKNIQKHITTGFCPSFSKPISEKLLDDYGLLLFKTYNDNGTSTKDKTVEHGPTGVIAGATNPLTKVDENNRRKSALVSKQLLSLNVPNATKETVSYILIDDKPNMDGLLKNLLFKGFPMNLSTKTASTDYNNGNIKVSPGEIVAVIPNLFNGSNTPMAGVHLLANDWDHTENTITGTFKPCVVDGVTTTDQGAEAGSTCATPPLKTYKRNIGIGNPAAFPGEAVSPVCMVQLEEGEVTKWVSQNEFRKKQGLSLLDSDCLGFTGTSTESYKTDFSYNAHECLMRVLPGANHAYYSKIDAQKSYTETIRTGNPNHVFGAGNAIIFEVNKWIPPGTKFRCRLRANFSNCSDCFNDPKDVKNNITNVLTPDGIPDDLDDYPDFEYNGAKPFKVINIEFDIND